jgi:hypothetical protein
LVQTNFNTDSLIITEESNRENKKKEVYSLTSLNYFWPLDPAHFLHKEEFKQKLKKVKNNTIRGSKQTQIIRRYIFIRKVKKKKRIQERQPSGKRHI